MRLFQSNVNPLVLVLVLAIVANTGTQLVLTKTVGLSPWKGGGFGMYTDPHPTRRIIWLVMEADDGVARVEFWPATAQMKAAYSALDGETEALQTAYDLVGNFAVTPNAPGLQALADRAAELPWSRLPDGSVGVGGTSLSIRSARFEIYEMRRDVGAAAVYARRVDVPAS